MANNEKIVEVLGQLDPLNDDHWTTSGDARVEAVEALVGEPVRRQDIVNAAPDFNREKAGKSEEDEGEGDGADDQPKSDVGDGSASDESQGDEDEAEERVETRPPVYSENEFLARLRTVPKERLEDVELELKTRLGETQSEIERGKSEVLRLKRAINFTRSRIASEHPNSSDQEATRAYIESQNAARIARVKRRETVLQGISPREFDTRSPLDTAMQRKTGYGRNRPAARAPMK